MVVAVAVGRQGIDTLLVVSQVILSIVLPFVMFPLIWLTSSSVVMRVKKPKRLPMKLSSHEKGEKITVDSKEKGVCVENIVVVTDDVLPEPSARKSNVDGVTESKLVGGDDEDEDVLSRLSSSRGTGKEIEGEEKEVVSNMVHLETIPSQPEDDDSESEYIDYSNGWITMILSYFIWLVVVVANGYLLVTLAID